MFTKIKSFIGHFALAYLIYYFIAFYSKAVVEMDIPNTVMPGGYLAPIINPFFYIFQVSGIAGALFGFNYYLYALANCISGAFWLLLAVRFLKLIERKITNGDTSAQERIRKILLWAIFILMAPINVYATFMAVHAMAWGSSAPERIGFWLVVAIIIGSFFYFIFSKSLRQKCIALAFYSIWLIILLPFVRSLIWLIWYLM